MENRISIVVDAAAGPLEQYFAKALANYKNRGTVSAYLGKIGGLRETITPSYREFTSRTSGSLE